MSIPAKSPLYPFPVLRYDAEETEGVDGAPAQSSSSTDPQAGTADMDVNGLGSIRNVSYPKLVRPVAEARPEAPAASTLSPKDTLEISKTSRASGSAASQSLRAERLAQIKASIEDGSYDTPERLEAALDRMFSHLGVWND